MTHLNDFGGHAAGRTSYGRVGHKKGRITSFNCRDCGKLEYVANIELTRAARPRCKACGGTLVESKATEKKKSKARKTRLEQRDDLRELIKQSAARPRCWCCGIGFGDDLHISMHLTNNPGCVNAYRVDGRLFDPATDRLWKLHLDPALVGTFILDTLRLEPTRRGWCLTMLPAAAPYTRRTVGCYDEEGRAQVIYAKLVALLPRR